MQDLISNPFCTRYVRPGAIAFRFGQDQVDTATASLQEIIDQLVRHRTGLIIGPHGSGKSTLLQSLLPQLGQRFSAVELLQTQACQSTHWRARITHAFRVSNLALDRQRALCGKGLLIIDGLEQLTAWHRKRLTRLAKRQDHVLLGTSHQPIGGFHPIYQTEITAELVHRLTAELLADSPDRLVKPVLDELECRDLHRLSDLRSLWFDLYDIAQSTVDQR